MASLAPLTTITREIKRLMQEKLRRDMSDALPFTTSDQASLLPSNLGVNLHKGPLSLYPDVMDAVQASKYARSRLPRSFRQDADYVSPFEEGTGRHTARLGPDKIIKIARKPRGIMENTLEGTDPELVPPALWRSDDNTVVIVPRAEPIRPKDMSSVIHDGKLDPYFDVMDLGDSIRNLSAQGHSTSEILEHPTLQGALSRLKWERLKNYYDPLLGDLVERNTGRLVSPEYPKGRPVITDAGVLSADILRPEAVTRAVPPDQWLEYLKSISQAKAAGGHVTHTNTHTRDA